MLFDFLFHLVSLQFCTDFYAVRVPMPLGPTSVLCGSLCCPGFYVTWSHVPIVWVPILSQYLCHLVSPLCCMGLCVVRVSMSLGLNYVLYVSMLSVFLCHLVSLPFCMGLYVVRFCMSLGLTSVMYVYLCCLGFYIGFILPLCSCDYVTFTTDRSLFSKMSFELSVILSL